MSYAIYVGKNLTAEVCTYLAGYGDEPSSHWLDITPARAHPRDATITVGVTAAANFPGELIVVPQVPATAKSIGVNYSYYKGFPAPLTNGGLNEHHVAVRDVWSPSRRELQAMTPNPQRGLNYSDLARLVLARARSAREGVALIGDLIAQHGYATYGGNSHLIADRNEGWVVLEFAGGQGLWVAERLGADDLRISRPGYIGTIPRNYNAHPDYLGSPNLITFAVEQGWYDPAAGEPFHVNAVYGDGKMQWTGVQWVQQALQERAQSPQKITLRDLMWALRTPTLTGDTAGYGQIVPLHAATHPELGMLWHAPGAAVTAPFTPFYLGVTAVPPEYQQHRYLTAGEAARFMDTKAESPEQQSRVTPAMESTRSAFQLGKRLFYLTMQHHEAFLPEVTAALTAFENRLIEQQTVVTQTAQTLYEAGQADLARHYLTYVS
ncbi:MAG: C69 family dipeptidase, partial [Caldilineaceae bacterium]|nr:C69 family dipeptidase [Caldilineaceae bacterium]